jgi:hypothetical protein
MAVIFLDIEGVLVNSSNEKIQSAAHQLIDEWRTPPHNYSIHLKRAITHSFSETALDNLMELIKKTEKVAKVGIIISSSWREELPVDGLIQEIFVDMPFADRIIDKIPDSHSTYLFAQFDGKISPKKKLPSDVSTEKYGFSLTDDDRSKEIDFWLRENKKRFQIDRFVIINNYDQNIVDRYPDHAVQVNPAKLLTDIEATEAYHILLRSIPSSELDESVGSTEFNERTGPSEFGESTHSSELKEKSPNRHSGCCVVC